MGKVGFMDNSFKFIEENSDVLDVALTRMAMDISTIAKSTVPFKSGDLFKNIYNSRRDLLQHRVIADREYAGYQEFGQRKDGSRVVKHYTTPSTGKGYLRNAAMQVMKDALNYLKQAVQTIRI